jgi:hypothetical protein
MSRAAVRRDWVSLVVLILGAIAFAVGVLVLRARDATNLVAYDFYGQFYPFMVHAWRSLSGGGGLLWNPYQDCGQPFFGNSQTGLLYPVNVLFAVLPREPAVVVSVVINLAIAGVGMFLLCREMRIGRVASLCGAVAFQLGWAASMLAAWSPRTSRRSPGCRSRCGAPSVCCAPPACAPGCGWRWCWRFSCCRDSRRRCSSPIRSSRCACSGPF